MAQKIATIRNLVNACMDSPATMANDPLNKIILSDIDQIYFFKSWYTNMSPSFQRGEAQGILDKLTEASFAKHCDRENRREALPAADVPATTLGSASRPIVLEEPD